MSSLIDLHQTSLTTISYLHGIIVSLAEFRQAKPATVNDQDFVEYLNIQGVEVETSYPLSISHPETKILLSVPERKLEKFNRFVSYKTPMIGWLQLIINHCYHNIYDSILSICRTFNERLNNYVLASSTSLQEEYHHTYPTILKVLDAMKSDFQRIRYLKFDPPIQPSLIEKIYSDDNDTTEIPAVVPTEIPSPLSEENRKKCVSQHWLSRCYCLLEEEAGLSKIGITEKFMLDMAYDIFKHQFWPLSQNEEDEALLAFLSHVSTNLKSGQFIKLNIQNCQ